jgi:hypothetical protein
LNQNTREGKGICGLVNSNYPTEFSSETDYQFPIIFFYAEVFKNYPADKIVEKI